MASHARDDRGTDRLDCPGLATLEDYLAGRLAALEIDSINGHVENCTSCLNVLHELEEVVRPEIHGTADSLPNESLDEITDLCRLRRKLERLRPGAEVSGTQADPANLEIYHELRGVPIPRTIGRYELAECLGQGAMGIVYKAWHLQLKREMVLKLLLPTHASDPNRLRRFQTEMAAIGRLGEHANVVRASDAGEDQGLYFIAMDYSPGLDVSTLLARVGALRVPDACEIVRQAALGLAYAHRHRILHRDVKPSNLLLTSAGTVKLLDLGLAVFQQQQGSRGDEPNYIVGTADYLAPERWLGLNDVGPESDIYSLGCTLYKLLTGQGVASGCGKSTKAKRRAHLAGSFPLVSSLRPNVSDELDQVVQQMLAKDPADRFGIATQVAEALQDHVEGADLERLVENVSSEQSDTDRVSIEQTLATRLERSLQVVKRSKRLPQAIGAVVLATGIALAGLFWATGADVETPSPISPVLLLTDSERDVLWRYDNASGLLVVQSSGPGLISRGEYFDGDGVVTTRCEAINGSPAVGVFYGYQRETQELGVIHRFSTVGVRININQERPELEHSTWEVHEFLDGRVVWMAPERITTPISRESDEATIALDLQFDVGSLKSVSIDGSETALQLPTVSERHTSVGEIGVYCEDGGAQVRWPRTDAGR